MQTKDSSPPDGGYGWVVVVSAFIVMGLTAAVLKTFGLFFAEIQEHFDELASTISWITSITIATFHLGGLGISFSWTPAISIVSHYFSKRRALANAIASAGECVFAFTFGPFFQWLIGQYGWKGALLIIGGTQLNICVCGILMRPLTSSYHPEVSHPEPPPGSGASKTDKEGKSTITHRTFNWMLLRRAEFVLYAMFGILAAMSFFVPPLFLVPLSYSLGIETIHLLTMTITLISTSLMLLPLANNYLSLAIFTGFYGFFFGTTVAVHITVLAEVVGMSDFDSALGLFMLIRSIGGFLGPPLAGLIVDMAGDYRAGFYMAGATLILAAVFLVVLDQFQQRSEKGNHTGTKSEKSSLPYTSFHFLKLQKRRYQDHNVAV
ncbi:monocarboxylate transporter 2-like [Phasianus colchicus]|uniref:monocarboxylate transporter 2-like n=1 Tax=Phasianus colchicus TaxID=9054 RepID=UPI00129D450D|nr:monocarboxylate transporter 2-like [Phasianus colchicus]